MNRKEFLKSIGAGAAFAITVSCFGGCSSGEGDVFSDPISELEPDPITGTLFAIDLSDASSSALKNKGGYLIQNNIIIAKDLSGNYVAATVVCSHEQKKEIIFKNGEYYCTAHGARFNLAGNGLNSDASRGLKIYNTLLEGTILSITA
jgi:nitrite reductase/ring-hydroxylating ferredoxin subunit